MLKINLNKIKEYEKDYLDDIGYKTLMDEIIDAKFSNDDIKKYLQENLEDILTGDIDKLEETIVFIESNKTQKNIFDYKLCSFLLSTDLKNKNKLKDILKELNVELDGSVLDKIKFKEKRVKYVKEQYPTIYNLICNNKIDNENYKKFIITLCINDKLKGEALADEKKLKLLFEEKVNKFILFEILSNTGRRYIHTVEECLRNLELDHLITNDLLKSDKKDKNGNDKYDKKNTVQDLKNTFKNNFNDYINDDEIFKKIFDYNKRIVESKLRHKIISSIGINVCPYCGRQFITNYIDTNEEDKTTADLDHFYIKSKYPYLALSLYNFIPSCQICNSRMKLAKDFYRQKHLYPYREGFENDATFDVDDRVLITDIINDPDKAKIVIKMRNNIDEDKEVKIENNKKTFKLDLLYKNHSRDVQDLIKNIQIYSESYIDGIVNVLYDYDGLNDDLKKKELAFKAQELSKIVFREKGDDEILSKLHNDILNKYWKK